MCGSNLCRAHPTTLAVNKQLETVAKTTSKITSKSNATKLKKFLKHLENLGIHHHCKLELWTMGCVAGI